MSRETIEAALSGSGVVLEAETERLAITTAEADLTARIHFKDSEETETVPLDEMAELINQIQNSDQSNLRHQLNNSTGEIE